MTSISDTEVVNAPGGLVELAATTFSGMTIDGTSTDSGASSFSTPITLTFVSDGSPIVVEWFAREQTAAGVGTTTTGESYVVLFLDGVFQQRLTRVQTYTTYAVAQSSVSHFRLTPSAGTHTIEFKQFRINGNGAVGPGYARVSKVLQASQLLVTQSNAPTVTDLPSNPVINQEVHHLINNSYFDKKYNGSTWVNINEQPSVEIVAGAGQTGFVVDTWTKLTFPSATVTNNFGFTISNGIITIPSNLGGLYHVSGQCQWDANNSGIRLLTFAESGNYNGTVLSGPTVPSASYMRTPVSGLIRLTGGQSYCLWGINSGSGGTRDLIITFLTQRFNIARVSS